jgi:hypothetical protein
MTGRSDGVAVWMAEATARRLLVPIASAVWGVFVWVSFDPCTKQVICLAFVSVWKGESGE